MPRPGTLPIRPAPRRPLPWTLAAMAGLPFLAALLSPLLPGLALQGHDLGLTFGPKLEFAHRWFPAIPLWQPEIYGGQPFAGNPQAMAYYPATFLFGLLGWSLPLASWVAAAHVVLAAFTFRGLALRLGAPEGGARIGALAWALGAQAMGRIFAGHLTWTYALPWIPLLLAGLHEAVREGRLAGGARAGLAAGLLGLCGAPQAAAYGFLAALAFLAPWFAARPAAGRLASLPPLGAALVVGGLMLLAQALPTAPFLPLVAEGGRLDRAGSGPMAPAFLTTALFPKHFAHKEFGYEAQVGGFSWEQGLYGGVLALLLALRGLLVRPDRRHLGLALLCGAAVLFALGDAAPLFPLARSLPLLGAFRTPGRMMLVATLALALLAALGYPRRSDPLQARPVTAGIVFILFLLGLLVALFPGQTGGSADRGARLSRVVGLAVVLAEGIVLLRLRNPHGRPAVRGLLLAQGLDLLALSALPAIYSHPALPPGPGPDLAAALDGLPAAGLEPATYRVDHPDLGALGLFPDLARRGLHSTRGNYDPGASRAWLQWLRALDARAAAGLANDHPLDLMAVRFRFAAQPGPPGGRERWRLVAPGVHLAEREGVPARCRWLPRAQGVAGEAAWWRLHLDPRESPPDPAQTVTLLATEVPAAQGGAGEARLVYFAPGRIEVEVACRGPGLVVLSEPFQPGWAARLDGRAVPLLKADLLFQAVAVAAAGRHRLELRYRPPGAGLSPLLAGAGLALGLILLLRKPERRPE